MSSIEEELNKLTPEENEKLDIFQKLLLAALRASEPKDD